MAEEASLDDLDMSLERNISLLKQSKNLQSNDPFFDKILKQLSNDTPQELLDPITKNMMVNPVILSSGIVMDKSSIVDSQTQATPKTTLELKLFL